MVMKKSIYYLLIVVSTFISGCSMDKLPGDKLNPDTFFKTENDLSIYTNSMYDILPTGQQLYTRDANLSDNIATANSPALLVSGNYTDQESELSTWWKWDALRNINYFLERNNNEEIPLRIRANYNGIARFFRAWFYFEKVKTFGDVPWCDKALSSNDPDLFAPRDSRVLVMDKIIEDINYAIENIIEPFNRNGSTVTRSAALALKSRICLFEGTYRKYSGDQSLKASADNLLAMASEAAQTLINQTYFDIYKAGSTPYRDLFAGEGTFPGTEVILGDTYSSSLARYHEANWLFTSSSFGSRPGLTKTFVNTFLNSNGTRFTDNPAYDTTPFQTETKNRDSRLSQTIRTEGYKLLGVLTAPDFGHSKSGYHLIKYTQDNNSNLGMSRNTNSIPLIRYAEVLLNLAEAKAELGQMTDQVWNATIGVLRSRAKITNISRPSQEDQYMKSLYPNINSADLLEIRRERAIELVAEGFRFDDLRRWRAGNLLTLVWDGVYVESHNVELDMNGDGKKDVCFVTSAPASPSQGVYYYLSSATFSAPAAKKIAIYSNITKRFPDKNYLYPIPKSAILKNSHLTQNSGWTVN